MTRDVWIRRTLALALAILLTSGCFLMTRPERFALAEQDVPAASYEAPAEDPVEEPLPEAPAEDPIEEPLPEAPVDPTAPEAPVEPTVPEAPIEPTAPEAPVDPTVPETPVDPTVPEAPVDPTVPEAPVDPTVPEAPVDPTVPEAPVDPTVPEAPVEEPVAEPIPEHFQEGYVSVSKGEAVYVETSKHEVLGAFTSNAVVYAQLAKLDDDPAKDWLLLTFDTQAARDLDAPMIQGYIQYENVSVLTADEAEQAVAEWKKDSANREYRDMLLPRVSFKYEETEATPDVETPPVAPVEEPVPEAENPASDPEAPAPAEEPVPEAENPMSDVNDDSVRASEVTTSLTVNKGVVESGEEVRFTLSFSGNMQFVSYSVIDQWGNKVFENVSEDMKTQDWTPTKAGDYKGIAVAYDGAWHSAETGWFTVKAIPFSLKGLSVSGDMRVNSPLRFAIDMRGEMLFASYSVIDQWGNKIFENVSEDMKTQDWTPTAAGDYKGIVVVYDGQWHSAETSWFTVADTTFQLKGLYVAGDMQVGSPLRFTMDSKGTMQFANYSVINQWGVTVFKNVSEETVQNWTPTASGDYKGIVVAYDGNWHSAETGWFTVEAIPFSLKSVTVSGELIAGAPLSFTIDTQGEMQFASYTVIDCWGNKCFESICEEKSQSWTPIAAGDYKCIVVAYDGEWHSVETNWFTVKAVPFVLKGVTMSGKWEVGSVMRFTLDMQGEMQFASYTVIDHWGNKVLENVSTQTFQDWTPTYADDYQMTVVVYTGEWHGTQTGWFTVASPIFEYEILVDGTSKLTKYNGTDSVVIVPETFAGAVLTEIGEGAFEGNTTLVEIDLPDTVRVIGKRAFANCTSLSVMK